MSFIGRAWKVNVNVWKRHLTLQSVFNHGECMMHVDKNVDSHVVDQNVDRISREIAYVPLGERIRSKHSSYMQSFFFFFFFYLEKKNEYKTCLAVVMTKWGFQSCFLEDQRSWNLDMLPRGPRIWILDVLPRGSMDLKFGHASQRSNNLNFGRASQRSIEIEFWTCFLEVQGFEFWTCFLEVRWIWSLDALFRGPMELNFGCAS